MRGVPTFIHESNAIPGKANKMTARLVRAVLLGFKECAPFFPKVKTEVTGTPIRTELQRLDRKAAREKLGLSADIPTLLVMGGSQGASGINQAMIKSLPSLDGARLQLIHLTGTRDEKLVADNYRRAKLPAFVAAFHHRMEELYSAADFAVARSGAASLAELAAFALPAILIPFPYAADDHQARNAEVFVKADAAILVKESEILDDALAQKFVPSSKIMGALERMSQNCGQTFDQKRRHRGGGNDGEIYDRRRMKTGSAQLSLSRFLTREHHRIHLIGVAGSGMSGIAALLLELGHQVSGSDKSSSLEVERLQRLGLQFFPQHRAQDAVEAELIVYSSAIKPDNPILVSARQSETRSGPARRSARRDHAGKARDHHRRHAW